MSNILVVIPSEVIGSFSSPKDKIVITGEFDDWQHSDYVLQYDEKEGYKVEIPRLTGKEKAMFKLVINDREWITLSYFETTTDNSGHTNNVLNYHDYDLNDALDDVTIGSTNDENEQQEQLLSYTVNGSENEYLSPDMFPQERLEGYQSSTTHTATNDYVNISSHGELSSTEDLDFDPSESDLEETIQYDSNVFLNTNQRPLNGLVSIAKRARTYWNS